MERLADVETIEMLRWFQRRDKPGNDVRFRLRQALHADELSQQYQSVLIDCPPRLTTACVNALAASDYVVIPVLRDPASTERVPQLLKWLSELKDRGVCKHLTKVGVLANNVNENEDEREAWKELPGYCSGRYPFELCFHNAMIAHNRYYGLAARQRFPAVLRKRQEFERIRQDFAALDAEIKERMP